MDEAASEDLKQQLFDHCVQDKYRMRYKWHAGDALIWDNTAVMHSATTKDLGPAKHRTIRSEEHTSELQSLMRISYAVFCLKKKKKTQLITINKITQIHYNHKITL